LIGRAAEELAHRGPDRQAVFESGSVSIAAARLKIRDLVGGDQPMSARDAGASWSQQNGLPCGSVVRVPLTDAAGDTVIAFNGEIYNHAELRAELEQAGHKFQSAGDTETVLRAFLEWDTECFSRLRGMFAIALWTESERRLVLARDRMGIKPLYVARRGEDVYFGSELKSIFVHPEIDRNLDLAALDCYLALNYVPGPRTLVQNVEKLRPGYWLEWRDGKIQSDAYWTLPLPSPRPMSLGDAAEELDSLLQLSVREHLLSDVPLGLWLSGGIDSSTILHYASHARGSPLKTFSVSFSGRSFDETGYIRPIAARYGAEHEELDLNPGLDLPEAIESFASYADEPNADAGALPVWFLSKMTSRSVRVALSGEGTDELFGGYLTYRANDLARTARRFPPSFLRWGIAATRLWPVSDEKISFEYKVKRFLEGCRMRPERAHVYWNGTFSDREKQYLLRAPLPGELNSLLAELARAGDRTGAYLWFDQKYFLPDDILAKVDRISMAHSIEVRPPFLDHRIVEFAAQVPDHLKIRGAKQKVILRHLMKNRLPEAVLRRKKVGFDIPAHEWLRGPLLPLVHEVLATGLSEHADVFDGRAIKTCLEEHLARRANFGYHLWGLMILFLWMRRWNIQTNAPPEAPRQFALSASTVI
jgi:asparagine synthase (glutamine-hydrolysing)